MTPDELRNQGIAAAKARQFDEARRLLTEAVQANPQDVQAWLYLATVSADDPKGRLRALRQVLALDPTNETALKAVRAMGIDPARLMSIPAESHPAPPTPATPPLTSEPAPKTKTSTGALRKASTNPFTASVDTGENAQVPAQPGTSTTGGIKRLGSLADMAGAPVIRPSQPDPDIPDPDFYTSSETGLRRPPTHNMNIPGVPAADADYLAYAIDRAQQVASSYLDISSRGNVRWIHKTKNRAGERDIWALRFQTYGAIFGVLLVLGGLAAYILTTNPDAQRIVLGVRTVIPSRTPTNTPTPTPGFTNTPTATLDTTANPTYTPSATIALTLSPVGRFGATPRATQPYLPESLEGALPAAVARLGRGEAEALLPTLAAELEAVSINYNPNPYYYNAIALADTGRFTEALAVLTEAEERLETDTNASDRPRYKALVDLAFAQVAFRQGAAAVANNAIGNATGFFENARERAETTIAFDPRYIDAHFIISDSYLLQANTEEALAALDRAQLVAQLAGDVGIVMKRAEIYLSLAQQQAARRELTAARENYQAADHEAFFALYLNPYDQRAHEIRIISAIAQGVPGDAVLANDTYRLYYPDSPRALRLLGQARQAEGNIPLALAAFDNALSADLADDGEYGADAIDVLVDRSDLRIIDEQFALAYEDLTAALEIQDLPTVRLKRMNLAYASALLDEAFADAAALIDSRVAPNSVFYLMQARVLLDRYFGVETEEALAEVRQANTLLARVADTSLTVEQRGVFEESRARTRLTLGNRAGALEAISAAIDIDPTNRRLLLRGKIWEGLDNLQNAIADYQRVLEAVQDADDSVALEARDLLEAATFKTQATATSAAATAIVEATATTRAERTATRAAIQTETATHQPSPTPSLTPSATLTPSVTFTPSRTPTPTATSSAVTP